MKTIWQGKKRLLLFGLPWTFTTYTIVEDKMLVDSGILTTKQDEIRLYRIMDVTLTRTLAQRIFKLGTITCNTVDKTSPILELKNITDSARVKELLSEAIEKERVNKRVSSREFMTEIDDEDDDDFIN